MPVILEDFEDAIYAVPITGTWVRTAAHSQAGAYSLTSPDIGDLELADVNVSVPSGATSMRFWYKVESDDDPFMVLFDGGNVFQTSGMVAWTQSAVYNVTGVSIVTFRYAKHASGSSSGDAAWIDNLTFTVPGVAKQNFDGGSTSTAITTDTSGMAGNDALTNIVGVPHYSSAISRTPGGLSAWNSIPGADSHIDWVGATQAGDVFCARAYIYRQGTFSGLRGLLALIGPSGIVSKAYVSAANLVLVYTGAATANVVTSGTAIPADKWVRLEFRYTINSAGNGTVEVWTYLDPDSATHSNYVTSATVAWPGGKPRDCEFHVTRGPSGLWYLDDIAIGSAKLGPVPKTITRSVAQPADSGRAQPITRLKRRIVGQAVGQENAPPAKALRQRPLGPAEERMGPHPIARLKAREVNVADEAASAGAVRRGRGRTVGRAVEGTSAGLITGEGIAPAFGVDAALPITPVKLRQIGRATEMALAGSAKPAHLRLLSTAAEMTLATTLLRAKRRTTNQAVEAESSYRVSSGFLVPVEEAEMALPITPLLYRGGPVTGVDGPYRTWSAASSPRRWSVEPLRRTWSASQI